MNHQFECCVFHQQYALEKQEMSGESLVCLCVIIVFCFFVELTIFPRYVFIKLVWPSLALASEGHLMGGVP